MSSPHITLPDSRWTVEARKYDDTVHYRMSARLVSDDGQCLRLHGQPHDVIQHVTRGVMRPRERLSDFYFWRDRWYNIYVNYTPAGAFTHFYCNIGLPPQITGSTVSFVDLDLDVVMRADGSVEVLDMDEFRQHAVAFSYPPAIQQQARAAIHTVLAHWRARRPPFDRHMAE